MVYIGFEARENKKIVAVVVGWCPLFLMSLQKCSFWYLPFLPRGQSMAFVEAHVTSDVIEGFLVSVLQFLHFLILAY